MADKQGDARLNDILDTLEQAEGEQQIADMLHGPTLQPFSFMNDAVPQHPDIGDSPPQPSPPPCQQHSSSPNPAISSSASSS